jgi:hypothetical protein
MGVAQALISIFAEDDDKLRSIIRTGQRIAFVLKAPLYLFCVSDWGEPEHVVCSFINWRGWLMVVTFTFGVYPFTDHLSRIFSAVAKSVSETVKL